MNPKILFDYVDGPDNVLNSSFKLAYSWCHEFRSKSLSWPIYGWDLHYATHHRHMEANLRQIERELMSKLWMRMVIPEILRYLFLPFQILLLHCEGVPYDHIHFSNCSLSEIEFQLVQFLNALIEYPNSFGHCWLMLLWSDNDQIPQLKLNVGNQEQLLLPLIGGIVSRSWPLGTCTWSSLVQKLQVIYVYDVLKLLKIFEKPFYTIDLQRRSL